MSLRSSYKGDTFVIWNDSLSERRADNYTNRLMTETYAYAMFDTMRNTSRVYETDERASVCPADRQQLRAPRAGDVNR